MVAKPGRIWGKIKRVDEIGQLAHSAQYARHGLPAIDTGREPGISSGPGLRFFQLVS
jgi:hypothetical protein